MSLANMFRNAGAIKMAKQAVGEPEPAMNPYEQNITEYAPSSIDRLLDLEVNTLDQATADAEKANIAAEQRAARERSRYGVQLTAAEQAQASRLGQIQGQANLAGARTQSIRTDEAINRELGSSVLSLLTSQYQSTLGNLLNLGQIGVQRKNAYENARAASRSQHYGFLGSLGNAIGKII